MARVGHSATRTKDSVDSCPDRVTGEITSVSHEPGIASVSPIQAWCPGAVRHASRLIGAAPGTGAWSTRATDRTAQQGAPIGRAVEVHRVPELRGPGVRVPDPAATPRRGRCGDEGAGPLANVEVDGEFGRARSSELSGVDPAPVDVHHLQPAQVGRGRIAEGCRDFPRRGEGTTLHLGRRGDEHGVAPAGGAAQTVRTAIAETAGATRRTRTGTRGRRGLTRGTRAGRGPGSASSRTMSSDPRGRMRRRGRDRRASDRPGRSASAERMPRSRGGGW